MTDGSKTSTSKRDSLKALRSDLSSIASRLQAADTATEQTLDALKAALKALVEHGDADSAKFTNRHAQLETQIKALQSRLTSMIRETQKAVNTDLKTVLNDPRLSTLAQAIDNADARLRKTEMAQAQNLTRLQSYISKLAREVDTNLSEERKARQSALASVEQKQDKLQLELKNFTETLSQQSAALKANETRIKSVETDTATALRDMGEKIASFAQQATESRMEQEREIKGKVSDIALETQRNFDLYRDGLDRNIEAMQAAHDTAKQDFTRDLDTLRTRLETLEYGMRPVPAAQGTALEDAFTPPADPQSNIIDLAPMGTQINIAAETPMTDPYTPEPLAPEPLTREPLAPSPYIADPAVANPYAQSETPPAPVETAAPQMPYPDSNYAAPYEPAAQPQGFAPIEPASPYGPIETLPQAYAAPQPQDTHATLHADPAYMGADDMPYANPAYAEVQPTMEQARPGSPVDTGASGAKRSAIFTPNNLRAAVLGVAVLGGSYFAYNKLIGQKSMPDNTPAPNVFVESNSSELVADNAETTIPNSTSIKTLEPIGNYAEDLNRPLNNSETTLTALETAASEGNDIAEYQLGLIKLQAGDVNAALALLRQSANKGQAAAQYRLAKLYETGNGVTQDLVTARELIEKAARNGNRIAMHDLANFYANGIGGTEQDLEISAKWFEKAAERGVVDSQYNVGYLYEFGFGVTKNLVEAYVWYGIAATQGDTEAGRRITALNETLSPVEIDSAKKRIDGFKPVKLDKVANGIFENLPWQPKNTAPQTGNQIVQAQSLLNSLGYSVGTADGQIGAQTRNAVIAFEKANGLPETGRINTALVDQLSLAAGA